VDGNYSTLFFFLIDNSNELVYVGIHDIYRDVREARRPVVNLSSEETVQNREEEAGVNLMYG
jgi:hypothetical protein